MTIRVGALLLAGCSLLAAQTAYAQPGSSVASTAETGPAQDDASAQDPTTTTPDSAQTAAIDSTETAAETDIIVTARRRDENLQDVPISITVVSGEQLTSRGVSDSLDLQYQTPSLSVTTAGASRSALAYSIRGQRTNETQILTDPPVGTYFAEVVVPRTFGFGTSFYDIQNIQVLKGVQGTLFGRNMTGGAVLIEPNHPDLSAIEIQGTAQYGNYDLVDLTGTLNLPLIKDVLAVRFAGRFRDRDGFTRDVTTGVDYDDQHYYALRGSVELHLGRLRSYTVVDYLNERGNGSGGKLLGYSLTDPINGRPTVLAQQIGASPFFPVAAGLPPENLTALFNQALATGRFEIAYGPHSSVLYSPRVNSALGLRIRSLGITNRTTLDVGPVTFKNIFGYRKLDWKNIGDYDGSPAALIQPFQFSYPRQVSEEFQMQGTPFGDRFNLTLGAFYFREKGRDGSINSNFPQLTAIGFASATPALASYFLTRPAEFYEQSNVGYGVSTSYAFYGAGTFEFSDQFSVSGGLRYNNDERRATVEPFYTNLSIPLGGGAALTAPCYYNGVAVFTRANCAKTRTLKNEAVTYDVTAQYEPTSDITAYLALRHGYRAGGFSLRATSDATFQPFQPESVTEYEAGLRNIFNLGLGRLNTSLAIYYQDYSDVQKQNATLVNGQIATVITNTARQHNYGGEFEANLNLRNGLGFNMFYSHARNKVVSGGNGSFEQQGVPRHQLGGGVTFQRQYDLGEVNFNVNATYRSSAYLDDYDAISLQRGYALVNARLGISDISGSGIGLAVFARNLTNTYYKVGVLSLISNGPVLNGVNPGGGPGFSMAQLGEPRTYGVELAFKF
jgi:iron complex outermembrane recepter protein